jgi:hypothetical protein
MAIGNGETPMASPDIVDDLDKITPLMAWFVRVGLAYRSGHRLLASGEGPTLTKLSERRYGVRERDHRAWLERRAIKSAPPPGAATMKRNASR